MHDNDKLNSIPRAPFVFAAGLLAAAGLAMALDGAAIAVSQAFLGDVDLSTDGPVLAERAPLDVAERAAAEKAWGYIAGNTRAETGFVDAVEGFASATLWDQGSYLLGLVSAQRLGIVQQEEFDLRVDQFLGSLGRLELFEGTLPNKVYNTQSLAMVNYANEDAPGGIGWSALDIARLLMGLRVIEKHYTHHGPEIRRILAGWDLAAMAQQGELIGVTREDEGPSERLQEGRIGYEQYAARAAALWGLDVVRAISAERIVAWREIEGIDVATDLRRAASFGAITPVLSEPYLLLAFELGLDAESALLAHRVYAAQAQRFKRTGLVTMVSEDHLDAPPHFAYSSVISNGKPWAVVSEDGSFHDDMRSLSTKASFGWDAVFATEYSAFARERVISLGSSKGYPAGIYEASGEVNDVLTLNTNAIILQALHYQEHGPLWSLR
ncbi:MAG: DUF3131 domain-containing protein [Pseudomonadota bacterium]